jgi:hypothetical protein
MVPPLVAVNAKYYAWRVALCIAAVMFVSIVASACSAATREREVTWTVGGRNESPP